LDKRKQSNSHSATKRSKLDIETLFEFENEPVLIIVDNFGKVWFKAVNVARILEYGNTNDAILRIVSPKNKIKFEDITTLGLSECCDMHPSTVFIAESGLYRLIMRSKMPKAEKFTDWVVEEVLPSIRKSGQYSMNDEERTRLSELNA